MLYKEKSYIYYQRNYTFHLDIIIPYLVSYSNIYNFNSYSNKIDFIQNDIWTISRILL